MERDRKRLRQVTDFLDRQNTLALATTAADGSPDVAPLFYLVKEDVRLYWFSASSSRHSRNLRANMRAACTVFSHTADWKLIRGVQMRGAGSPVSDPALRREIANAFRERFQLGPMFDPVLSKSTLYCFQPDWLRYIDNSRRFGYQFELSLPGLR